MLRIRLPRAAQGAMTALALLAVAAAAAASPATPVATGDPLDPLTPMLGNRGYDVLGTTITLEVDVAAGSIVSGSAAILAEATAPIDRVAFDFRDGLATDAVAVDGRPAEFVHRSDDLVVDLPEALHPGEPFTVDVRYHGTPGGHPEAFERGWWADGESVFIVGEPGGAEAWFPANNHPSDAAVFTLVLAVPEGVETVAGGRLVSTRADGPRTVTRWSHDKPIPAYLLTFAAGDLDIVQQEIGDVGITLAFPPDFSDDRRAAFDRLPDILGCLESWYGDYPSDRFGAVVVDDFSAALETEGMSVFGRAAVNEATIAHELAHHWFGNDVRLASWQDIWLNEGFGRYAEVLWAECADGPAGRQRALAPVADAVRGGARAPARHAPIGDPAPDALFDGQVYNRGALTLDALRRELGDEAFRRLLIAWHDTHAGEAVVTADFIALASGIAGRDLTGWFEPWLEETDLPPGMPEPPPATTPVG